MVRRRERVSTATGLRAQTRPPVPKWIGKAVALEIPRRAVSETSGKRPITATPTACYESTALGDSDLRALLSEGTASDEA